jgi:hypothetical protein
MRWNREHSCILLSAWFQLNLFDLLSGGSLKWNLAAIGANAALFHNTGTLRPWRE